MSGEDGGADPFARLHRHETAVQSPTSLEANRKRRERVRQIAEDKLRYVDYRPTFDSRHNVERWLAKAYRRGDTKAYDDALAELDPDTRARVETRLREQRERLRRLAAAGPRSQEARDAAAAAAAAEAAAVDEEARRVAESEAEAALLRAAREGRWRDVDDALAEGRSHPFVCDEQGFTLLHYAARNNSRKLAKVMLLWTDYAGHPPTNDFVNRRAADGSTALHLALECGHRRLGDFLLRHGASDAAQDAFGRTPHERVRGHAGDASARSAASEASEASDRSFGDMWGDDSDAGSDAGGGGRRGARPGSAYSVASGISGISESDIGSDASSAYTSEGDQSDSDYDDDDIEDDLDDRASAASSEERTADWVRDQAAGVDELADDMAAKAGVGGEDAAASAAEEAQRRAREQRQAALAARKARQTAPPSGGARKPTWMGD